jgi:hypothetical protein
MLLRHPPVPSRFLNISLTVLSYVLFLAYAGSKESPSLVSFLRDWFGLEKASSMALRERFDFGIVVLIFGVVGAACVLNMYRLSILNRPSLRTNTFSIFTAQIFVSLLTFVMRFCLLITWSEATCWLFSGYQWLLRRKAPGSPPPSITHTHSSSNFRHVYFCPA